jgi:hypothetical protein
MPESRGLPLVGPRKRRRLLASGACLCKDLLLATLPVTFHEVPPVAFMHPMVRHPSLVWMRMLPVAGNPHVLAAFPPPISARPNVPRLRGWSVRFYTNGRRGHHNCWPVVVVPRRRRGGDDASAECDRQHGNCYHPGCSGSRLRHMHSLRLMVAAIDLW